MTSILQAVKNLLKPGRPAEVYDLCLFPFDYIRRGRLLNLSRGERYEASNVSFEVGGGKVDAVWVRRMGGAESLGTVVYCNPNAAVWELMGDNLGLDLRGGGRGGKGWTETYLRMGYDVVGFNYRGYGRSCFRAPGGAAGSSFVRR